ncbi:MAG: lipid-A-disaccharide synthase [bacterium JZ-2024 1]
MANIFFLAGELSGDLMASHLASALKGMRPDLSVTGAGSLNLRSAGADLVADTATWGAIGVVEGVKTAWRIRKQVEHVINFIQSHPPKVFIPVDFPFLNIRMARIAKAVGARVAYLCAPVSWQWLGRKPTLCGSPRPALSKLIKLRGFVDIAYPIYPFAVSFYRQAGIPVEYAGHPEVTRLRTQFGMWREESAQERLAIFPGSRIAEIHAHLPVILDALARWSSHEAAREIWISVAHPRLRPHITNCVRRRGILPLSEDIFLWRGSRLRLHEGSSVQLMADSRLSVMVSGTVVHQAMAIGAPCIAIYRVSPLLAEWTHAFLLNLPHYALPNLLAGREICPELIQDALTPARLAETLYFLWHNPDRRAQVSADLVTTSEPLVHPGGIEKMAQRILEWV